MAHRDYLLFCRYCLIQCWCMVYTRRVIKVNHKSIPKDSATSLTRSDNYRGISLFNSICKLLDHVIIFLFGSQLEASDMQFGFKRSHSTVMCSLIFKEIVDH